MVDPIVGLRPLFFRTLRTAVSDDKGVEYHWLTWKHQAYQCLAHLKENETELIRIYIGFCKEQSAVSGMDKVKEFPSLDQAGKLSPRGPAP